MKISTFKANTHLSPDLVDAVINQFGDKDTFKESAQDVANHGIDGGFHGFIYYADTVKFADDNKALILALAEEQASDFGYSGALELIASFGCLNGDYSQSEIAAAIYEANDENETQIKNALAWYAAEEVCRAYADMQEAV